MNQSRLSYFDRYMKYIGMKCFFNWCEQETKIEFEKLKKKPFIKVDKS